jgi:hypothetical protein
MIQPSQSERHALHRQHFQTNQFITRQAGEANLFWLVLE